MTSNRRKFLKWAGLSSAGVLGSVSFKEANLLGANPRGNRLAQIRKESSKKHSQIFNMSGYSAPKLDTVRVGIIGVGNRGKGAVVRLSFIEGVVISGICDNVPQRAEASKEKLKSSGHKPIIFSENDESWMKMCQRDDLDLIYITTPWELHAPMALYAMEHGKHVAVEIPVATTIEDCWKLVQTSERTKKHCVMLENCCYDKFELLTLNLARNGFFGDIVHCEGAYIHEIGESLFHRGNRNERWRLKENIQRNGNLYPTHGLGPVAQIMNLNRGNRMDYLVSTSTDDFLMNDIAKELSKSDEYFQQYVDASFRGNMNTTTIKTGSGQTIMIQHDITTPRPYDRIHLISGTKGTANKYPLPPRIAKGKKEWMSEDEFNTLEAKYNPPIALKRDSMAGNLVGRIDWMEDFMMDWRLIDCLRNGLPVDIDVYDAASWSAIAPLSEWSVANRSAPIDIPDFTLGAWEKNVPHDISLTKGGTTGLNLYSK